MTHLLPLAEPQSELSAYAYSYPHKSSYRPLTPRVPIATVWRDEDVSNLSLYVHIPFCEMRCGFCNLFTQSQPAETLVNDYLAALGRQMRVVREAVPTATFHQFAIGGGTPTYLSAQQLSDLLTAVESVLDVSIVRLPTSIETSPETATPDRLRVLANFGIQRVSLGVQSFSETETRLFGRPQQAPAVHRAIQAIRDAGSFDLNLDLIYGHPDQSAESWQASLQAALQYRPEELYLYPLYVRPETGLERQGLSPVGHRSDLYRIARDRLLDDGYEQLSLRCFRVPRAAQPAAYACQRDGMIGLGCGARSYTRELHYATRFAVTQAGVRSIVRDWIAQSDDDFAHATHGMWLSDDEQLRRYVILTLLQTDGLSLVELEQQFPGADIDTISGITELRTRGWLLRTETRESLTPAGLEHADEVGPILYSPLVRDRLRAFTAGRNQEVPS
ncbi:MAG: STM4012 family radical SAM protein [Planctomycetota bacterium]